MLQSIAQSSPRQATMKVRSRRGVSSVLAMMFLVLFGSLVAAMAITSRSNIRTASTHLEVMQAMSAAETGMSIAERRLTESAQRFIVSNSTITPEFVEALWQGNLGSFGGHTVAASPSQVGDSPGGLAEALVNFHALDTNIVIRDATDLAEPGILPAWPDADTSIYKSTWWVITPIVALKQAANETLPPPAYQIVYAPLTDGVTIRVISIGYDFVNGRPPMTRTITRDFRMNKGIDQAIISPSRVMIGKNVHIVGDLGVRYDDVAFSNADPLVTRSDFYGLDPALDARLDELYALLNDRAIDVDGDNRLRVGHPVEGAAIPFDESNPTAFSDATGDGYVDEFDVFINFFDQDGDRRVHIATELVNSEGNPIDPDLALLIDGSTPDRNRNGVFGFHDLNNNGRFEPNASPAETLKDWILVEQSDGVFQRVYLDGELGYLDGYIDAMDRYVKMDGRLTFRTSRTAWLNAQGNPDARIEGAIRPQQSNEAPQTFNSDNTKLPPVSASSFDDTASTLLQAADGEDFWVQVQANLAAAGKPVSLEALRGPSMNYIEATPKGQTYIDAEGNERLVPRYLRVNMDLNGDGLPDNWETAYYEPMPMDSPNVSDWYYRPVFEGMVFRNVVIPMGLNALFVDCTFVGVNRVQTHTRNHGKYEGSSGGVYADWSVYGQMRFDSAVGRPVPRRVRYMFGDDPDEYAGGSECPECPPLPDSVLPPSARPPSAMLLMALDPLDKGDVPAAQVAAFDPAEYAKLPDPLIIRTPVWNGSTYEEQLVRVTDSKQYSNNLRLHNCTVVGSVVSDTPLEYTHLRNKIQFTGSSRFMTEHPTDPTLNPHPDTMDLIERSSMMLPNFSVDVGTFNSPESQDVKLQGAIIAGVLDIRGNAEVDGSIILTFKPTHGDGPLVDLYGQPVGNPAGFNATIGYFGPDDGDLESFDPTKLPIHNGVRIVGWDLNGDGFADLGPTEWPTQAQISGGAIPLPFNGYGRVRIRFNPDMQLPDGIMLPMRVRSVPESYREGKL